MSDDATPRLGLPYVAAGQAQKHVTVNEAMARLDGLVQTVVTSRSIAAQPADPEDGALYILPEGASGEAWSGFAAGTLVRFEAGGWAAFLVRAGHLAWVLDERRMAVLSDGWKPLVASTVAEAANGARSRFSILEEDVALSGASAASTLAIPARAIVLGVGSRTLAAVTGASAYDCGVAGEAAKFGGSLGVATGSTNMGVIGPTAVYANTPVVLTAIGAPFTGGVVRLSVHLLQLDLPEA
ncbi:DUF2793 domain-containing protein [Caulobacter mirabilis]|uniref:Ribonuclease III n=1 Tax=Caulobacter mirabilis TaxID=69666 RepID=A0A2D2AZV3_9CAUL|nr:DUF2793 domain-containing protein [Caulobacter mirabilis]ATQ43548.1 ribonuclease III [Caulobacter mirabilis]